MFFHFSALPANQQIGVGDELTFKITRDSKKNKYAATDIHCVEVSNVGDTLILPVFSMNMPFAALLANGYKTIETRNGTMFTRYSEGTKILLHVGQRNYPDGDRHVDVMKADGLGDDEIQKLKSLPDGYKKGMVIAIVELGETFETSLEQRCNPDFQRSVVAFGQDSGMRATKIRRVQYLNYGVPVSGSSGVFNVKIEKSAIPDGWL